MSLEEALAKNTAALLRVAELLEVSNADRAALLAKNGVAAVNQTAPATADDGLSVAEIKEAAKGADLDTLKKMLADEKAGKARTTAINAIEAAIEAKTPKADEGKPAPDAGAAATASTAGQQAASPSPVQNVVLSGDEAAKAFGAWFSETDDEAERNARRGFVQKIVEHLGKRVSELDEDGRRKAIFFLRRKQAGLTVDFGANYDFSGDPQQSVGGSADDDLL